MTSALSTPTFLLAFGFGHDLAVSRKPDVSLSNTSPGGDKMVHIFGTVLIAITTIAVISKALKWRKLYNTAKSTGFPVFLSPVHVTDIWWLMLYSVLVPIIGLLPNPPRNPWLSLAQVWNIWKFGYHPFLKAGSDTLVLATPQGNLLWTCDPRVCHQLETRPQAQVDVDMVKFFEVYGPTVGSVEGDEWKAHRRVITSGFTASTHAAVWTDTVQQTRALIERWKDVGGTVTVMKEWTCRLALHVISGVFFRKTLAWNEHNGGVEPPPSGHDIRYDQALFTVLARLGTLYITPRVLLGRLPFKGVREAHLAFTEWTMYMRELQGDTLDRVTEIAGAKHKSILESIVLAGSSGVDRPDRHLPEKSILGNIFFTLLAGHETTGNTMAFALNLLAVYPQYQRKVQQDIDRMLVRRSMDQWTVETEYQALSKGWIGAVLKEVLRLYCVVQFIPRVITRPLEIIDSKGISHTLPEKTLCLLNFSAAFRNPNTWPQNDVSSAQRAELHDSPAIDFNPGRWIEPSSDDDYWAAGMEEQGDGAPPLFAFGQGPRACPGRMFAQIEMTAAIATILSENSLELVVDDQTRQDCKGDEAAAWKKTQDQAIRKLVDEIESNISIQLLKDLPIRLTSRSS